MQFADPAWQPSVAQDTAQEQASPAPQPTWAPKPDASAANEAERAYAQGYRTQPGQTPPGTDGSFQAPPQRPLYNQGQLPFLRLQDPRHRQIAIIVLIVLAVLFVVNIITSSFSGFGFLILLLIVGTIAWLIYTGRMRVSLSGEAQAPETRSFEVHARPTIVINNKAGAVRVRAGQEGQVSITTTRRGYLFNQQPNNDSQISYSQDSTINRVAARVDSWRPFGKNAIDFDLVVPPQASLELVTNAGSVFVQNISGQMTLRSDAGTITAEQVELRGQSRLRTNAGTITFSGALDTSGDYEFITDLGTINATLPAESSFTLDAKTDLGTVSTNFPTTRTNKSKASGQVGSGPYPRLRLQTDLGTIRVTRG